MGLRADGYLDALVAYLDTFYLCPLSLCGSPRLRDLRLFSRPHRNTEGMLALTHGWMHREFNSMPSEDVRIQVGPASELRPVLDSYRQHHSSSIIFDRGNGDPEFRSHFLVR